MSNTTDFNVVAENVINADCEDVWVSLNCNHTAKRIAIATNYRHPSSDPKLFIKEVNNNLSSANLFLVGISILTFLRPTVPSTLKIIWKSVALEIL